MFSTALAKPPSVEKGAISAPERKYELVGQSPRLRQLLKLSSKLGRGQWPVLLLGETGTGKEVVARTIHRQGPGGPFVAIDCASLVGPLMESELFGHVRGSFTGAVGNKPGLIEMADGGTAFFDEIGELPLDLQAKLLRVLQEHEFRPVGGLQMRKSSFRVIAATNRDLKQEVEKGTFRRDLYYRLNVVAVRLAPLRDRKDDLPVLLDHFMTTYAPRHAISHDLREMLMNYDWPGNVRELENCIQHMVALNSGPLLHPADAPSSLINAAVERAFAAKSQGQSAFSRTPQFGRGSDSTGSAMFPPGQLPQPAPNPVVPLFELEHNAIISALQYTKGDRMMAAHLLGIGRTTLYRKLKEYNMEA